ncbi:MAG: 16S rRNA (guanine(527)-N(7))-methyltransferase RsmG [Chloroflexi bacterium]|nr:16S rRNA (guanine(527)-N(7))-methyltransferase RsmG [Chloroflexota bacterium]
MGRFADEVFNLLGIRLSDEQRAAFDLYARELVEWNRRFNLTSITDPEQIRIKHFLDSLSCWLAMREQPPGSLVDVGAGAGFPGIPLKILKPDIHLTLVEATAKKTGFLLHIVQFLRQEAVHVATKRVEEFGHLPEHREAFDWAVARAVAPMPVLAEYLLPLVKIGGYALAQKGKGAAAEVEDSMGAFKKLGGELSEVKKVVVPGLDEDRYLVIMKKISSTPQTYPRRPGVPSKRPLG